CRPAGIRHLPGQRAQRLPRLAQRERLPRERVCECLSPLGVGPVRAARSVRKLEWSARTGTRTGVPISPRRRRAERWRTALLSRKQLPRLVAPVPRGRAGRVLRGRALAVGRALSPAAEAGDLGLTPGDGVPVLENRREVCCPICRVWHVAGAYSLGWPVR